MPRTPLSSWARRRTRRGPPRLTRAQVSTALKRAHRRNVPDRATAILAALHGDHLGQPPAVTAAYAASVRALAAVLVTLNEQIAVMQEQVEAYFGQHPAAEVILSQPGLGLVLGARVLAEFGDDPHRYASAKARKNYAGTSPITRASGKKKTTLARFVHNDRLIDALMAQAFSPSRARRVPAPTTTSNATAAPSTTQPCAARQPPRRNPARLPQDRHAIRRGNRLVSARQTIAA